MIQNALTNVIFACIWKDPTTLNKLIYSVIEVSDIFTYNQQGIAFQDTEFVEYILSRPIIYVAFPMSNWLSLIFLTCHGFHRR